MSHYEDNELDPGMDPAFQTNHSFAGEYGESLGDSFGDETGVVGAGLGAELEETLGGLSLGDTLGDELDPDSLGQLTLEESLAAPSTPARKRSAPKATSRTPTRTPSSKRAGAGAGTGSLGDELTSAVSPALFSTPKHKQVHAEDLGMEMEEESEDAGFTEADEEQEDKNAARTQAQHDAIREELQDTLRTTDVFLAKLRERRSTKSQSTPASGNVSTDPITEDTATLEANASTLLRQLQDLAQQREGQVRELREMSIAFAKPGLEWQAALAEVAGYDDEYNLSLERAPEYLARDEADDSLGFINIDPDTSAVSLSQAGHPDSDPFSVGARRALLPSTNSGRSAVADGDNSFTGSKSTTALQMHELQACTESLITSLGAMNEHAQVHRAAMNDASRKLRSVRTVLTQWKTEMDGVARSRAWIEEWERGSTPATGSGDTAGDGLTLERSAAPSPAPSSQRPDDIKVWTNQQIERFEKILGDAEVRARELLRPVNLPASFDADLKQVPTTA